MGLYFRAPLKGYLEGLFSGCDNYSMKGSKVYGKLCKGLYKAVLVFRIIRFPERASPLYPELWNMLEIRARSSVFLWRSEELVLPVVAL